MTGDLAEISYKGISRVDGYGYVQQTYKGPSVRVKRLAGYGKGLDVGLAVASIYRCTRRMGSFWPETLLFRRGRLMQDQQVFQILTSSNLLEGTPHYHSRLQYSISQPASKNDSGVLTPGAYHSFYTPRAPGFSYCLCSSQKTPWSPSCRPFQMKVACHFGIVAELPLHVAADLSGHLDVSQMDFVWALS